MNAGEIIAKFHTALDACASTDAALPSLVDILDGDTSHPAVAVKTEGREDITPPNWPLRVFLDRKKAEELKDDLLKGFSGWSATFAQPTDFTQLAYVNFDIAENAEQWTSYQAKVLVAMAVAHAMGWADFVKHPDATDTDLYLLRMRRDAFVPYVSDDIKELSGIIESAANDVFEQYTVHDKYAPESHTQA